MVMNEDWIWPIKSQVTGFQEERSKCDRQVWLPKTAVKVEGRARTIEGIIVGNEMKETVLLKLFDGWNQIATATLILKLTGDASSQTLFWRVTLIGVPGAQMPGQATLAPPSDNSPLKACEGMDLPSGDSD